MNRGLCNNSSLESWGQALARTTGMLRFPIEMSPKILEVRSGARVCSDKTGSQ